MKFKMELAKTFAKKSCKQCFGRGYQIWNTAGQFPIVNRYRMVNGQPVANLNYSPTVDIEVFCKCSQKKVDKLEEQLKDKQMESSS